MPVYTCTPVLYCTPYNCTIVPLYSRDIYQNMYLKSYSFKLYILDKYFFNATREMQILTFFNLNRTHPFNNRMVVVKNLIHHKNTFTASDSLYETITDCLIPYCQAQVRVWRIIRAMKRTENF